MFIVKKNSLHGAYITDVITGRQSDWLLHQPVGYHTQKVFWSIISQNLFNLSFFLSILWDHLDEFLKVREILLNFSQLKSSQSLVEVVT